MTHLGAQDEEPSLPDTEGRIACDSFALPETEDDATDAELAQLNAALERGFASITAGRFRPVADVIAELRRR